MEQKMTMQPGEAAELPPWEDPSERGALDKAPLDKVQEREAQEDKAPQDKAPQEREAAGTVNGEGGSGGGRWVLPSLCSALELLLQVLRFFSRRRGR